MQKLHFGNWNRVEVITYICIMVFIITNAIIMHDAIAALISSICGISYLVLAGKGTPLCYIIGLIGAIFYCLITFQNHLFGHLSLYLFYYIPMQFLGFIQWKKNLQKDKAVIIKSRLTNKERLYYFFGAVIAILITIKILYLLHDIHPILDGITTIFSLLGMYFTVKRCIEQWIAWMFVNGLSLLMWIFVVLSGTKAYSTLIMWVVYSFLAFYFYFVWNKELKAK